VSNKNGGEEVRIDPANTAPVHSPITDELYDIGNNLGVHLVVSTRIRLTGTRLRSKSFR
jgi:hypothetical protein